MRVVPALLLDEPVSASARRCGPALNPLAYLQDTRGLGHVFVRHDEAVVRDLADRVVHLR
ncbi:hypothetical protein [Streptomyces roseochromogenus]|uniref:hypothetical protein n=1 Tax=Streptomyces roseochromogenus TaxID=285450 RepID=UPI001319DF3B|nr:hypothetical protein [Streptomyces roseochromogenus]